MVRHLGAGGEPHIVTVHDDQGPIGSMPLSVDGVTARFLGSHEVCDYQDLICAPGRQADVMETVIAHLSARGIHQMDMRTLRPEAMTLDALEILAPREAGIERSEDDMTYEMALPDSWEGYLLQLDGKQRHEVRRKLRRMEKYGRILYCCTRDSSAQAQAADTFITLFRRNRPDKAAFMTGVMETYFRELIRTLADQRMLRLCFLEVNDQPAAGVLCFDYQGVRYLYNSGYDEQFETLSAGVLSKVLSIRNGIEMECRQYDFLKGAENYKKRIGGHEKPLYRCRWCI